MKNMFSVIYSIMGGILLLVFILFFRYQYLPTQDGIAKIDRITGNYCYLPCFPSALDPEPPMSPESELQRKYEPSVEPTPMQNKTPTLKVHHKN